MAEPRLLIDQSLKPGAAITLDEGKARHAGTVLRLDIGDRLRVFNAADGEWRARVTEKNKRGMGVTVALPLLEAMVPARTALARTAAGRVRLSAIEMVHGSAGATVIGAQKFLWSPERTGSAFDLSPGSLAPLEPFRDALTDCETVLRAPAEPATIDGDDRIVRQRIVGGPAPYRPLQRQPAAEGQLEQHGKRVFAPVRVQRRLDAGDDLLGGDVAPALEDRAVIGADIGKMPVEAAARDAHGLGQRLGLQRREAAAGQRLQALVDPILRRKLLRHGPAPCRHYHTQLY